MLSHPEIRRHAFCEFTGPACLRAHVAGPSVFDQFRTIMKGKSNTSGCAPCESATRPLKGSALAQARKRLKSGWEIRDQHHLEREFSFPDFKAALAFTNQVGALAEEARHHPDLELSWGRVLVKLWTHSIDGLSDADFELAAKVDRLA